MKATTFVPIPDATSQNTGEAERVSKYGALPKDA